MTKTFASRGDLKPKKITFKKLSPSCYAFTAEGDPNTGVVVGDDGVLVVDAQATHSSPFLITMIHHCL